MGAQVNIQLLLTIYLPRFLPTAYLPLSLCLQSISLTTLYPRYIAFTFSLQCVSCNLPLSLYLPVSAPKVSSPAFSLQCITHHFFAIYIPHFKERMYFPSPSPPAIVYLLPFSSNVLTYLLLAIYPLRFPPPMYLYHLLLECVSQTLP